ncbi:receptor-type tyrosine-protein phosphatase eta-like [Takifugu flavidus]|uniref:receptor-type tyrosine-protein phosphatase eta-like n=1 Tax=Takifugu flavidus TaxID=433684 RepID=UPI00254476FF|nr:receptor-type tyrosine-protein phosphatase eta-like [Takifugu flavidus]
MKPLLRVGVPLWSLLISSSLLKICQAQCDSNDCNSTQTGAWTTAAMPTLTAAETATQTGTMASAIPTTVGTFTPGPASENGTTSLHTTMQPEAVTNLQVTHFTTSSATLNWTKPAGGQSFKVQWTDGINNWTENTTALSHTIHSLTPGVQYNVTVSAVAADGWTEGKGQTVSLHTKPAVVGNLTVTNVMTSSLSLSWAEPEGNATLYTIRVAGEGENIENTTTETSFVIKKLTPGSQYNISVAAVAVHPSNEGERASTSTFTRPEKPGNIELTERGTVSLSIRWPLPRGKFQHFLVDVNETGSGSVYKNATTANAASITGLGPGRSYAITVTSVAGSFEETSEQYEFATSPTPPGSIMVSLKTNSSLLLEWATPALMEGAQTLSYNVTYQSDGKEMQTITTSVNRTELFNLSSGTLYNITLITVGIQNLHSTAVHYSDFTRPNPVLNLVAIPKSISSLEVKWSYPQGAQASYTYFVSLPQFNTTVSTNSTEIHNLDPGTCYNITVKTVVAPQSESTEEKTHACTMPRAVSNLTVKAVNMTAIQLTWLRQPDYKGHYSYLVVARQAGTKVQNDTTAYENYTFSNLTPGALYYFEVFTVADGVRSEVTMISIDTKPAPATNVTVTGSTTNLSVSWRAPPEQVVSYAVLVFRDNQLQVSNKSLDNRTTNTVVTDLVPGVYYCVVVVTKSKTQETNSSEVCRATVPNPPGSIVVMSKTINSINISWPLPQYMDHKQYNFTVSSVIGNFITENSWFLLDNLQSGTLYNISVATVGVCNYKSTPVVASSYTKPHPVHNLTATEVTTNTVTLTWEQLESKPSYLYLVQPANDSVFWSTTVNITTVTITGLTPGSRYNFTVTSQTADGTQALQVSRSFYTHPDRVHPSVSTVSNSSLLVSWRTPQGGVEHYLVRLNSSFSQDEQLVTLNNTSTNHVFGDLSAGRLYSVQVTVCSGPCNASSGIVSNATFPNPPGPLHIPAKTNNSIDVKWQEAPLMTKGSFHYRVSITAPEGGVNVPGTITNHTFTSLLSGTSYNLTVLTVGALGFESEKVQIYTVNTRPFSVNNLSLSSVGLNQTTLVWDHPDEYKESYRYNVTWKSSENVSSVQTREKTYNISDLVPGSRYQFFVTTETFDGTQADSQSISNCTDASPVSWLQCNSPNTPDATLLVSWASPRGQYDAFEVNVNDDKINRSINTCCSHNVSNLQHHTVYHLTVRTQSCGRPSISVSRKCRTGITNPPSLQGNEKLVQVSEKTDKKFSIQIDSRLLNDTNGPITHVGALLTHDTPDNSADWRMYLGKTYAEWKESKAQAYLATVMSISDLRGAQTNYTLHVGDESKWENYTNGPLDPGGIYHFAVVVFTDLVLENNVVNGVASLVSSTSFSQVDLIGNAAIGIAIGVTLGFVLVFFIILIGFIIYWRRLSSKEEVDIQIHSMRSMAVRMEDYEVYYRKQKADSNCGFAEEFEDLKPVGTDQPKGVALTLENKPKNRYNNVLPYDSSRVKLSIIHGNPYDDYINANYIPGYNSKKEFIAAQGPLPSTVKDFWRMIWEKNVQTLVMLTRCNEQGRIKCEQYWDFGTKHFENINVTAVSDIPLEDWTIRDFDIKNVKTAETRSVRQFHFTAWPDHGVPETTELLINFRHLVREHMDQYSRHSPTVVHCSAGVGRTGTFIAMDRLIFQIERENIVDIYGIVHDLRMHRSLMVQTEDQYVFLNQCALDIIRSRTGTNVDLIYQNTAALSIYENIEPHKNYYRYPDA